jgi:competence protein ComEC
MLRPKIELQDSGKGNSIKQILFSIKHAFLSNIKKAISEPESSLLAGLVVGAKQSLGKQLLTDFRTVGVIHIVVLSGYNLTIVAQAMMRVFAFLPEMFSLSLGGIGIILFAIMTGGSATIVRASIMSILVLVAKGTHRDYNITRALLLAGFLMVMQNPHILVFDPSFQLSFLATIALIYLAPIMKKYFLWVPEKFGFQELAVSTISTQLFVLPFLLYSMGTLSIVALPVNLLMLPLIPITMFFGFVIGMVSFISSLLALPFAFITHLLLWYELKVVDIFSKLPFASVTITHFPFWLMTSCYVGYAAFFLSVGTTEKKN